MKVARTSANKAIKDISNLLVDTQSWESRLREAKVPDSMVMALAETSANWMDELSNLRASLEKTLISALSSKSCEALDLAVQQATATIDRYNAESLTAKRLMAPAPKGKAKAKAAPSTA